MKLLKNKGSERVIDELRANLTAGGSLDAASADRDSAFAADVAKTNLAAILHQHGLETVRSL